MLQTQQQSVTYIQNRIDKTGASHEVEKSKDRFNTLQVVLLYNNRTIRQI